MNKIPKIDNRNFTGFIFAASLVILLNTTSLFAQSGTPYEITQSAIVAGGGLSANGTFTIDGTSGQPAAGENPAGGVFSISGGFRSAAPLAPTAGAVTLSGRILTADGRGIRSVLVTLTNNRGNSHTAISGILGYYRFANVQAGESYILSVTAKRFKFSQPSIALSVTGDLTDINFTAGALPFWRDDILKNQIAFRNKLSD